MLSQVLIFHFHQEKVSSYLSFLFPLRDVQCSRVLIPQIRSMIKYALLKIFNYLSFLFPLRDVQFLRMLIPLIRSMITYALLKIFISLFVLTVSYVDNMLTFFCRFFHILFSFFQNLPAILFFLFLQVLRNY